MATDSFNALKTLDIETVARAIELDAGQSLGEDLRESLQQAKAGEFAAVHTPEHIAAARETSASVRLDADVMGALRQLGKGWETRVNALLREAVQQGRI